MSKTFTLELKFVLNEEDERALVQSARRVYAANKPDVSFENEVEHPLTAEEALDETESALMRIVEQNQLLSAIDIRPESISCTGPDFIDGQEVDIDEIPGDETEDADDLDEW